MHLPLLLLTCAVPKMTCCNIINQRKLFAEEENQRCSYNITTGLDSVCAYCLYYSIVSCSDLSTFSQGKISLHVSRIIIMQWPALMYHTWGTCFTCTRGTVFTTIVSTSRLDGQVSRSDNKQGERSTEGEKIRHEIQAGFKPGSSEFQSDALTDWVTGALALEQKNKIS